MTENECIDVQILDHISILIGWRETVDDVFTSCMRQMTKQIMYRDGDREREAAIYISFDLILLWGILSMYFVYT